MGRPPSARACDIDGCSNKHLARGWCRTHYGRWRRHGNPEVDPQDQFRGTDLERLAHHSAKDPETGCHVWTSARNKDGYGVASSGGEPILAHRLALKARGVDIAGKVVRHLVCDNPPCVNPDHLAVGTHADNVADKVAKGRQKRKLSEAQKHALYVEYGIRSLTEQFVADRLARRYGIAAGSVFRVVRNHRKAGS